MGNWLYNHIMNLLCGITVAMLAYLGEIKGAVHVMWIAILFDLIGGIMASLIVRRERFSMQKFIIAIVRAFAVTAFVGLLYAMDTEMHQDLAASYFIASWVISGFYAWSFLDNMDTLCGGRIFKILKGFLSRRMERTTGVDLEDEAGGQRSEVGGRRSEGRQPETRNL